MKTEINSFEDQSLSTQVESAVTREKETCEDRRVIVNHGGKQYLMRFRLCRVASDLPTFVLESGGGGMICESWALIERNLAEHGRVFSYDRAGIGSSAGTAVGVRPAEVSERLAALLDAAGIKGPCIFIGYSLGGLYARYFAATRPDYVAGLVLVDPTPDSMNILSKKLLAVIVLFSWGVHILIRLKLFALISRIRQLFSVGPEKSPDSIYAPFGKYRHVKTTLDELKSLDKIQNSVVLCTPPVVRLPILCVSAGERPEKSAESELLHYQQLAESGLEPHSHHYPISGATHATLVINHEYARKLSDLILAFSKSLCR